MSNERLFRVTALFCMAIAVISGAVAANAPAEFAFMWELKATTGAFTG